jgi:uncharacterized protein with HEPN domain
MSKREPKLYLEDILLSLERIEEYAGGMKADQFYGDHKTIDAVVKNLTVIGEASKNMPEEIKKKYSKVPWDEIAGMRNKVVHEYFGIDEEILWKTIKEDLHPLGNEISKIKNDLNLT